MADMTNGPAMRQADRPESPAWAIALLALLVLMTGLGIFIHYKGSPEVQATWPKILGVLATLGIFTILYKENPLFRFLEHIFVGLATAFGFIFIWFQYLEPRWYVPMMPSRLVEGGGGQWWMIFALLVGLLFYTVYIPRLAWMNRFIIGVLMGWSAGFAFQEFASVISPQVTSSFKAPITTYPPPVPEGGALNNIQLGDSLWFHPYALVFIVVLLCAMAYFFFSVEHRTPWIRKPANAGRYFIMIALGAIFGTTVMGRITLLIGRLDYLQTTFVDWYGMLGTWWQGLWG